MIDPSILLQSKPVQVETPLEAQAQVQQVQNLGNVGQLQRAQLAMAPGELQAQQLDNRTKQAAFDAQKVLDGALGAAYKQGPDGSLQLNQDAVTKYFVDNGKAHLIPGVLENFAKMKKDAADAQKTTAEAETANTNLAASTGAGIRDAGYDPNVALGKLAYLAKTGAIPLAQAHQFTAQISALVQQNPNNPDAVTAGIKQLVDPLIASSTDQRKADSEASKAGDTHNEAVAKIPGLTADSAQKVRSNAAAQLGAAKTPEEYAQMLGQLPYGVAKQFEGKTPAEAMRLGLNPDQAAQADNRAATLAKLNTPAELAFKAAQGGPEGAAATRALDILKQNNIAERRASQQPGSVVFLTPEGQRAYDAAMEAGHPVTIPRGPGGKQVADSLNRIGSKDPNFNPAVAVANFAADKGSQVALQKQRDAVGAFEQTALANLNLFLGAAAKIPDTGVPWANTPLRLLSDKVAGSANMAAVNAARQVANNEIAKVTSNPTLSGQLSDSARHEVMSYNPENATFKQTQAVATVLKQDMANRRISLDAGLREIKGRIAKHEQSAAPAKSLDDIFGTK